jgi:hypothetical protein
MCVLSFRFIILIFNDKNQLYQRREKKQVKDNNNKKTCLLKIDQE